MEANNPNLNEEVMRTGRFSIVPFIGMNYREGISNFEF